MSLLARIQTEHRRLVGKAISHRPDLRGREHIYSISAGSSGIMAGADTNLADFLGYATIYSSYVWVQKAIGKIVDNVVGLPLRVVDANHKPLDGHPLTELFAHVNDEQTPADLWSAHFVHMLLGGEDFIEVVPDRRGRPAELWSRRPDRMVVRPDLSRINYPRVAEFVWIGEDQREVVLPAESVIHDKFFNPLNPWRGLAPIAAVREGIIIDLFSQAWAKGFMRRGARPDFAIIAPQGITASEKERYLSEFLHRHQGIENAHLPVVLEDGVTDIKPFSWAPKDMEWLEQRRFSRDEVGAIFGVPDEIMGYGKDTYENFQTALEVFWTLTLRPLLLRRDMVLTNFFAKQELLRAGERVDTDLSEVGVLQEDAAPKIEMALKLWQAGVPFNVLDEKLNLGIGAVPGGEIGYVPSTMTPVGGDNSSAPPAGEPASADAEREAEMRRFRRWAAKRRHPDPAKFASDLLSDADKRALLAEIEAEAKADLRFVPRGDDEALPPVPSQLEITPDDVEHAIRLWDATLPGYAGLLDADVQDVGEPL